MGREIAHIKTIIIGAVTPGASQSRRIVTIPAPARPSRNSLMICVVLRNGTCGERWDGKNVCSLHSGGTGPPVSGRQCPGSTGSRAHWHRAGSVESRVRVEPLPRAGYSLYTLGAWYINRERPSLSAYFSDDMPAPEPVRRSQVTVSRGPGLPGPRDGDRSRLAAETRFSDPPAAERACSRGPPPSPLKGTVTRTRRGRRPTLTRRPVRFARGSRPVP